MLRCLLLLLIFSLPAQTALAAPPHSSFAPAAEALRTPGQGIFTAAERHIIRAELLAEPQQEKSAARSRANLPAGLTKQLLRGQGPPPGWQHKVTVGKRLDYHLYRQADPLPRDLLRRLPSSPAGTTVIRIDGSILRLDATTRVVLDIFDLHRQ